ncbi:hypothetical protein DRA4_1384 [Lactococcus lactis subsp. lactis bv. diacetylactis]|uniref:Uncharacterized protein n=1 Tax=Lactococcus lactis subsp. lactis TaxID=1360 RepID=A0A0V8BX49_LACLL|nr:hypothetical protein BSR25_0259 [Lactococcus lactis subsp. lactis bv. diacetylactis]EHE94771.1 hypothetical protein LLCRE1631_00202 [Lactococcus lactis subsp. lactis CNCM I-1631]KST87465.1 hypothetical protein KF7_0058 [Lactococcus lactis subsp. lactis]KST91647.1 hypothetical protein KF134_1164 [Lactococcus lactis subsp. lactis]KST93441.1 hypothetical protein LKF67_0941 [Lactococcus lactis subsp. lactis]
MNDFLWAHSTDRTYQQGRQFLKSAHRISVSKIKFLSSFLKNLGQKKFS